jgi:asparagine synthase (glutamine-hydrolysing)
MCGLVGFVRPQGFEANHARRDVSSMARALQHRGPDDAGAWFEESVGLAFGHRRLAVVDLSPAGHQPMLSACSRYVIVFNGEIYNHQELRRQLEEGGASPQWRGHSDTETLLACVVHWGLERTLKACAGMFALAVWDRAERVLSLARDRFGEKPLYYGWQNGVLLFGSELRALQAHPAFDGQIDRHALTQLLRHGYVPTPHSIYRGIAKLPAGHILAIALHHDLASQQAARSKAYWSVNGMVAEALAQPFEGDAAQAVDAIEARLRTSIGEQMLADVPLGAFLSGGIDSSVIVALMQAQSHQPVRTFTIGFEDSGYDEATHAKAVAQHLGTAHTELYIQPRDALSVVPDLPAIYDEPFADSSQIPTFLICRMARQHVTVALSGDAGDELFGGYNRYLSARRVWDRMRRLPLRARRMAAAVLAGVPPSRWDKLFSTVSPLLPGRLRLRTPGDKAHKLASVLVHSDEQAFYRQLVSFWTDPAAVVIGGQEPVTLLSDRDAWPQVDSFEHWMMAMDAQSYMSDDILVKVDRAAMANSLETRVPMLDHRVAELAWRMPLALKIREGQGKWLLRQVLYRHVPPELVERPKMGFAVPLDNWLRGPLREWAENLIDESRLRHEGYFHPAPIRRLWKEHLDGRRNWQHHLWNVLMFQAWLERAVPSKR